MALANAPLSDGACAISADRAGQSVYVTTRAPDGSSGAIYGFHVASDGSLASISGLPTSIPYSDSCTAAVVSSN
jgi:hypothetical protein